MRRCDTDLDQDKVPKTVDLVGLGDSEQIGTDAGENHTKGQKVAKIYTLGDEPTE